MKLRYWLAFVLTFTFSTSLLAAQAPASAPAGSTGQCKDGTYSTAAKKSGACSGHKGVQTWFAAAGSASPAPVPQSAAPSTPVPAQRPAPRAASPAATTASPSVGAEPTSSTAPASNPPAVSSPRPAAPGGGGGQVWVNTSTKVYHCPGTEFYGTTKKGKYMSESDAVAMGARADHNRPCSK